MSYSKRPVFQKMHCKVCESARKSTDVIASHYPKNRDGVTVCPTLLSQECRGCGKKGHTIGYCPHKASTIQTPQKQTPSIKAKAPTAKKPKQQEEYNVLYESSDEESSDEDEDKDTDTKKMLVIQSVIKMPMVKEETRVKKTRAKELVAKGGPMKAVFSWADAGVSSGSEDSDSD